MPPSDGVTEQAHPTAVATYALTKLHEMAAVAQSARLELESDDAPYSDEALPVLESPFCTFDAPPLDDASPLLPAPHPSDHPASEAAPRTQPEPLAVMGVSQAASIVEAEIARLVRAAREAKERAVAKGSAAGTRASRVSSGDNTKSRVGSNSDAGGSQHRPPAGVPSSPPLAAYPAPQATPSRLPAPSATGTPLPRSSLLLKTQMHRLVPAAGSRHLSSHEVAEDDVRRALEEGGGAGWRRNAPREGTVAGEQGRGEQRVDGGVSSRSKLRTRHGRFGGVELVVMGALVALTGLALRRHALWRWLLSGGRKRRWWHDPVAAFRHACM